MHPVSRLHTKVDFSKNGKNMLAKVEFILYKENETGIYSWGIKGFNKSHFYGVKLP